jgi:hypothetical protein
VVRVLAVTTIALGMLGSTVAGAVASAGFSDLPSIDALVTRPLPADTLVYDRTDRVLLADLHPAGYQHYQYGLPAMGRYLPEATVAIEDAGFWSESGVEPLSIARAAFADLRAHSVVQGGSTITQQLVKLRLVGGGSSFSRKLREAVLAARVSRSSIPAPPSSSARCWPATPIGRSSSGGARRWCWTAARRRPGRARPRTSPTAGRWGTHRRWRRRSGWATPTITR